MALTPLLPVRHNQANFFIAEIFENLPFKDDMASMEYPLFTLSKRPDMRILRYENGDTSIEMQPSAYGLPSMMDKDILLYCASVVMSKINPDHAAKVLGTLPEDFSLEVVNRMLQMESVQKEVLDKIEDTLRSEFMSNLAKTNKRDSHEMMAEIFNNFDRNTEGRFIAALEERNRDSAEKIKALMFTFEDLLKLDPAGIQTLLRSVDKDRLGICLKGASDAVRDLFFSNMSERAAKILREDMEALGPVRLREVDEAQMEIVNIAKDLADKGEILLADSGGDDELVY